MKANKRIQTNCLLMVGPDDTMDEGADNPLPLKCQHCTFPDLDYTPRSYQLKRGYRSPAEIAPARLGNFLVRKRVKMIIETVLPGCCRFCPTQAKGVRQTQWWLAVPIHIRRTGVPKPTPPKCSVCGEPETWFVAMGPVWDEMRSFDSEGLDVFKSEEYCCRGTSKREFHEANRWRKESGEPLLKWSDCGMKRPPHDERWTRILLDRDLYFSVRFEVLLKRVGVKDQLVRYIGFKDSKTSAADEAWITQQIDTLQSKGLTDARRTTARPTSPTRKWFCEFVDRKTRKSAPATNPSAVETKHGVKLPKDYRRFVTSVGSMKFKNVMGIEGITAHVLLPEKMDWTEFGGGQRADLHEPPVDGVVFAITDHGDAFVFAKEKGTRAWPVYLHDHEQNTLELFARNFTECIKRFVDQN